MTEKKISIFLRTCFPTFTNYVVPFVRSFGSGSYVRILDNTGVRVLKCLRIIKCKLGAPGARMVGSVQSVYPGKRFSKGEIHHAALIQLRTPSRRLTGFRVSFSQPAAILLKRGEWSPASSRVSHSMFRETRRVGFGKLTALALTLV